MGDAAVHSAWATSCCPGRCARELPAGELGPMWARGAVAQAAALSRSGVAGCRLIMCDALRGGDVKAVDRMKKGGKQAATKSTGS